MMTSARSDSTRQFRGLGVFAGLAATVCAIVVPAEAHAASSINDATLRAAAASALSNAANSAVAGAARPASGAARRAPLEGGTSLYWSLYPTMGRTRLRQVASPQGARAPQGQTIEDIRVEGNVSLDRETILFYMETRVGEPFDWAMAQQDFRALLNSDFFDDLRMRWEPGPSGGVVVIVEVDETPLLRQIKIEGTEKVDQASLVERMELLELPITIGGPIDRQLMRTAEDVLVTMLQGEEGLQFVQVRYASEPSELGGGVDAVYDVVEGDTVRIENVYFEGVTEFTQKEMRWMVKKTSEHWLFSFLTKNDRYSPSGFTLDQQTIDNEYRRIGYLDILVGEPVVEVYDVGRTWPMGDVRRLYVRVPIQEGPQYRLGEIRIEGNTRFTDEQLKSLVPVAPGALVDVKGIIDARDAMQNIYSNVGYFQVLVIPQPETDPATGIANIIYQVNENALYTVRRIEFEGNTNTRDYVMRRNLMINENDQWSQGAVNNSKFKIQQLGYFDNIEEEVTIVNPPTGAELQAGELFDPSLQTPATAQEELPGEVDIKFKLSEVGRNQISFGGGVSALEGAFVQLGYATRNLFGRGQTFSFNGQFGGRTTSARLSFAQPYLFDHNLRFGFDVFRNNLDFIDFQQKSQGISTRIGVPLDRAQYMTLFLEYNYSAIEVGDLSNSFFGLSDPIFNALFLQQGRRKTSSFRPFLSYNSVDSPFNPARGKRIMASLEIAGGPLGGELDFWKTNLLTTWYKPIVVEGRGIGARVQQLVAVNADFRVVEPYGNLNVIPIFERFFLGGSNSVRGTQLRAIGPVDPFGNIVGGTRSLQYNIEYIFQLANPVRIAVFHDAGAAWVDQFDLPLDDLRKTAGVEFRVFMPVFNVPFRFFWAYNFDPLAQFGEEKSSFEFAIGTTF